VNVESNRNLTRHAQARMQQRGIAPWAVDQLLRYGSEHHDHRGAVIFCLDGEARRRIAREGEARGARLDALRGVYVVVALDGTVRTVGHRTKRMRRQ
jgi:pimeloyl-CoA synthetase